MAGAVKHMERSRRSHRKPEMYGIYSQFERRAYTNKYERDQRKTLGQQLAGVFRKMMPQKRATN